MVDRTNVLFSLFPGDDDDDRMTAALAYATRHQEQHDEDLITLWVDQPVLRLTRIIPLPPRTEVIMGHWDDDEVHRILVGQYH